MDSSKSQSRYYLCIKSLAQKDRISHHRNVQNKNVLVAHNKKFSVVSKYNLSIIFLSQKRPYFPLHKSSKLELFVISKYQLFINFLPQKRPHFPFPKSSKQKFFSNQYISYFCHFFGSKKPVYSIPQKFKIRAL